MGILGNSGIARGLAQRLVARARARMDFAQWLNHHWPTPWRWDFHYQRYILGRLERVTAGEIDRLMIFMPPRHGKSELVTVRYSAWRMLRNPSTRVIIGAYNQTLASRFSRQVREIVQRQLGLSQERRAASEWVLPQGGGLRAVGVGAGVTGYGGDVIIIDDPVKSREEAESAAYRERVWDWYTNSMLTRLQPGGVIVLIMTRWHEADLAGMLLDYEPERWHVISLPAEAEEGDPLGRQPGEPLNPEWFGAEELAQRRVLLGRDYYALYQQRPQPREGGLFKRAWFDIVEAAPREADRVRYWDLAATEGGGDYTVGVRMAHTDGVFYVEDVVRGQWLPGERNRIIRQTALLDGPSVRVVIEQEAGASGVETVRYIKALLAGFLVQSDRVSKRGNKVLRAEPLAAQAEIGLVKLVSGAWNAEFLAELASFPSGAHDDQVDAAAGAFAALALTPTQNVVYWGEDLRKRIHIGY